MTSTRTVGAIAVGVIATLILAGCGRGDESAPSARSNAPIDDKPATGTIEVWAMGTEGDLLPELAEKFEAANPDATVKVTAVPWEDYAKKVQTAVASGRTPDATMVGASDLSSFAADGGLDPVPNGLVDPSTFYPGANTTTSFDGNAYGVPWYVETRSLFYRKDLAAKAGVSAPTTWDEYKAFLEGLKKAGVKYPVTIATGAPNSWQTVLSFMWQAGGSVMNQKKDAFDFSSQDNLKGLSFYQELVRSGLAAPNGPSGLGDIEPSFVKGDLAAFTSGPWEMGLLNQAGGADFVKDKVAVVPLPAGPSSNSSYIGGGHWSVFHTAQNRDGAWKFIRWMASKEAQADWFDISGDLPAVQDAWGDKRLASDANLSVFKEQLKTSQAPPSIPTWNEIGASFDSQIEQVAKGVTTPKAALDSMQSKATSIGTGSK